MENQSVARVLLQVLEPERPAERLLAFVLVGAGPWYAAVRLALVASG